jgi:Uma2 family endonuclease
MADFVKTRMTAKEYAAMPETNQPMELIYGELIILPTPKGIHQDISNLLAYKITGHILDNHLVV